MNDIRKLILDAEYVLLLHSDSGAIEVLDKWLEDWLYRKDECPNCGKQENENE